MDRGKSTWEWWILNLTKKQYIFFAENGCDYLGVYRNKILQQKLMLLTSDERSIWISLSFIGTSLPRHSLIGSWCGEEIVVTSYERSSGLQWYGSREEILNDKEKAPQDRVWRDITGEAEEMHESFESSLALKADAAARLARSAEMQKIIDDNPSNPNDPPSGLDW